MAKLMPGLERRLRREISGEVLFDGFSRGRYATDASHYQMMPVGVVVPRTIEDAERAIALAEHEGASVLARGGGTSQCGQTVNESLVVDCSKHLTSVLELDPAGRRCVVEPGIVLDELNRQLKPHGLWFPVDVSTSSRATIGGMAGNNSCGGRSLRYGTMRDNVLSIDAVLAGGRAAHFGRANADLSDISESSPLKPLARQLLAISAREAGEIEARFPKVQRRVGGYNLDALLPGKNDLNLAHILVGSEGTLAFTTKVELKLWPTLGRRAVGACHFGSFYEAMNAAQHLVKLGPIAVELVDRTMIALARDIAMFRPTLEHFVRGEPQAILLVEFGEDDHEENLRRLKRLHELMGDLGFGWDKSGAKVGRRCRRDRRCVADGDRRPSRFRTERHDVDEGAGKTHLFRRRLRRPARTSRRLHIAAHGDLRETRNARHVVRARFRRLSARPSGAEPAPGKGREGDAIDRRRGLCDGARVQGIALGRTR